MTRRKQPQNPISNQRFSMIDNRCEYRVCRHWGHVMLIGVKRRRLGTIERERMLNFDTRRWREIVSIAYGFNNGIPT